MLSTLRPQRLRNSYVQQRLLSAVSTPSETVSSIEQTREPSVYPSMSPSVPGVRVAE